MKLLDALCCDALSLPARTRSEKRFRDGIRYLAMICSRIYKDTIYDETGIVDRVIESFSIADRNYDPSRKVPFHLYWARSMRFLMHDKQRFRAVSRAGVLSADHPAALSVPDHRDPIGDFESHDTARFSLRGLNWRERKALLLRYGALGQPRLPVKELGRELGIGVSQTTKVLSDARRNARLRKVKG